MNANPRKINKLREQRIGDELYVYGSGGETLIVLNTVAMLIWSLCDGEHDIPAMTDILADVFPDEDASSLRQDIEHTLRGFAEKDILADQASV